MMGWIVTAYLPSGKTWRGETKVRIDGLRVFSSEAEALEFLEAVSDAMGFSSSRFQVEGV